MWNRTKTRIYLGELTALPPGGLHIDIEGIAGANSDALRMKLETQMRTIFGLDSISSRVAEQKSDIAVDVFLTKYRSGVSLPFDIEKFAFVVFWRPCIQLQSRVYRISSDKTIASLTTTKHADWREFFSRLLSPRRFFVNDAIFSQEQMARLLEISAQKHIARILKVTPQ